MVLPSGPFPAPGLPFIIGIGTDLCDIRRIEGSLARFGDRFTERLFTEDERRRCDRRAQPAGGYAQRFAAKEACAKALGTGFRLGVFWRDLRTDSLPTGQPLMTVHNGAAARLAQLTPAGMTARIDVSMTDEYPMAHAMVIISAVPA
ncbi:MAG: holo-ACP synthase [Rhodospirillales bacterium]